MNDQAIMDLCARVRQVAYDIHVYHGHGHLEKVYENALGHRLRKAGLRAEQQAQIRVFDEDGTEIGEYFADLLVEDELVIELKAAKALAPEHEAQILGYLKSSRKGHGLLINFGSFKFQIRTASRRLRADNLEWRPIRRTPAGERRDKGHGNHTATGATELAAAKTKGGGQDRNLQRRRQ